MPAAAPTYDLVLLLDSALDDAARAKLVDDAQAAIEKGGSLVGRHAWGTRALTYEIGHRKDAEYHLLQFQGPPALLETLTRTLRFADGVVRFRIVRLAPGTPGPPDIRPERPAVAEAPEVAAGAADAPATYEPAPESAAPTADAPAGEAEPPAPVQAPPAGDDDQAAPAGEDDQTAPAAAPAAPAAG
jgi:small subunit ribosomal protein S6